MKLTATPRSAEPLMRAHALPAEPEFEADGGRQVAAGERGSLGINIACEQANRERGCSGV